MSHATHTNESRHTRQVLQGHGKIWIHVTCEESQRIYASHVTCMNASHIQKSHVTHTPKSRGTI